MKKITMTLIATVLLLASCKDRDTNGQDLADYKTTTTTTYTGDEDLTDKDYNNVIPKKTYTQNEGQELATVMKENVSISDKNEANIQNFTAYGELINEVHNLSISPDVRDKMSNERAQKAFKTFLNDMPDYLKTRWIRKEVTDVQNAMRSLQNAIDNNKTDRYIKKQINRVSDEIEDLNNEIVDTRLRLDNNKEYDYQLYRNFVNNVMFNDAYIVSIKDFKDYDVVNEDRENLEKASNKGKMPYASTLIYDFNMMVSKMPEYLKIDDVMDAVEDVQKEMKEYQKEMNNPEIEMNEHLENIEEIDEALYDLNKELLKARKDFDEDRRDAIEEYIEDLNG